MEHNSKKCELDIQEQMELLDTRLKKLYSRFERIHSICNDGTLLPQYDAQELKVDLSNYIEAVITFQDICERDGLTFDCDVHVMKERVKRYLDERDSEKIKTVASTFFKLTTTAEAVLKELNESKVELSEIFKLTGTDFVDKVHPFLNVVNYLVNGISDEECDIIDDKFSRLFCRNLYKGEIYIDKTADIKKYWNSVDNTGNKIEEDTPTDKEKNTEQISEQDGNKDDTAEGTDQNISDDDNGGNETVEEHHQLFEDYKGYITTKTFKIEAEASAASIQVKRFRNDIIKKGHPERSFKSMELVGKRKVVSLLDSDIMSLKEYADFLYKKGYLIKINSDTSRGGYGAYALSKAGYESFSKDIPKQGYRNFNINIDSIMPINPQDLSGIVVARFKDITETAENLGCDMGETAVFWSSPESKNMAEGVIGYGENLCCGIFSTALEAGKEKEALDVIKSRVTFDKYQKLILLVYDKSDIQVLLNYFGFDGEYLNKLRFICIDNYEAWYDAYGNETENLFKLKPGESETPMVDEGDNNPINGDTERNAHENPDDTIIGEEEAATEDPEEEKEDTGEETAIDEADNYYDEEKANSFRRIAYDAILNNKYAVGMAMFKALAIINPKHIDEYNEFSFAVEDPARNGGYTFSNLLEIFSKENGNDLTYDMLELCSVLRSFFTEDICQNSYYSKDIISKLETNSCYKYTTELKSLVFELHQAYEKIGQGFDKGILNYFVNGQDLQNKLQSIRNEANSLLNSHMEKVKARVERLSNTRKEIFGIGSPMNLMLNAVKDNDTTKLEDAKRLVRQFQSDKEGRLYNADFQKSDIEKYIDEIWNRIGAACPRLKTESMKPSARNNIINRIEDILMIVSNWLMINESSANGRDYPEVSVAISMKSRIQSHLKRCIDDIDLITCTDDREKAAGYILLNTLQELNSRLTDGYNYLRYKYFYVEFLRTNRIELTESYMPYMEEEFHAITPFNLCERIEAHYHSDEKSWQDVMSNIFDPQNEDDGHDYGMAKLIVNYLGEISSENQWTEDYDPEINIQAGLENMAKKKSEFTAWLEMADNYGWIEENGKIDRIIADMEKREEHYIDTENFGFYYRTLKKYMRIVKRDGENHRSAYEKRLKELKLSKGDLPIFEEIEKLIKNDMYTVADDYMQQVEKNNRQEAPVSGSLAADNDPFSQMLSNYDVYFQPAKRATKQQFVAEYNSMHINEINNKIVTGRYILENWPRSDSNTLETKLRTIFTNMGLKMADITRRGRDHFLVTFQHMDNARDYQHPIGAFGTEMNRKGLEVFMLYGNKDATMMNTEIRKIMTSNIAKATLIIADTALSLIDRRKLAQKVKTENQNLTPYMILDRVMALFLANQPLSERWNILLRCALPFQYYNPYVESNIEICPEMFIGRREELEDVIKPGGANIIYGGRQLGKTALLHRAKRLEDNRKVGKWAIYLEIKHCKDTGEAALEVYKKLQDEDFLKIDECKSISWNDLSRKITKRIKDASQPVSSFLLLVDEADNFLKACGKEGYEPIDYLKRIQTDAENKFKFVLAGLHNVLRFNKKASDGNSVLPQLSARTIKPLSFKEASELIEVPLSYLGFKMLPNQMALIAQILSSTNYYPGLIQFYASRLVKSLCQESSGSVNDKPPYWLDENQILTLLKDSDFINEINNKFLITLGVDEKEEGYYRVLATVLAYCYFEYEDNTENGYTAEMILKEGQSWGINKMMDLDEVQITALLNELIELNILRNIAPGNETPRYIFNRASFRHILGDRDEVEESLLKICEA